MTGLVDTGNQLTEPLTGRAVSILSPGQAEKLLTAGWETERGMCLIPYHSIGKSGSDESSDCGSDGDGIRGKDRRDRASGARSQCSDT